MSSDKIVKVCFAAAAFLFLVFLLALLGSTLVLAADNLGLGLAATLAATIYPRTRTHAPPRPIRSTGLRVLKPAANNAKLGKRSTIIKGRRRGVRLYSLTLEERKTCPRTCGNWGRCYGNNMPFAKRYIVNDRLYRAIVADLETLTDRGRPFAVRLHVLGDFPSVPYVNFWKTMVDAFPLLHLYGYTHRDGRIGAAVDRLQAADPSRVAILQSAENLDRRPSTSRPIAFTLPCGVADPPSRGFAPCPVQLGRTPSCEDCGLCMNGRTSIAFRCHCPRCRG